MVITDLFYFRTYECSVSTVSWLLLNFNQSRENILEKKFQSKRSRQKFQYARYLHSMGNGFKLRKITQPRVFRPSYPWLVKFPSDCLNLKFTDSCSDIATAHNAHCMRVLEKCSFIRL
uniref:Uncharacterized protein n=1 Tax=Glossina palpalis gambiensis TaxID=67801 RepID=A0A1B0BTB2_9MUSC